MFGNQHRRSSATILSALGVIVALMAVTVGGAQAAKPGNSENAKKCQKGGWNNYVRSDGTAFTSEEECTSYAAKGGQLQPKPTGPDYDALEAQWRTTCTESGGTPDVFRPLPSGDSVFACTYGWEDPATGPSASAVAQLKAICDDANGAFQYFVNESAPGMHVGGADCVFSE